MRAKPTRGTRWIFDVGRRGPWRRRPTIRPPTPSSGGPASPGWNLRASTGSRCRRVRRHPAASACHRRSTRTHGLRFANASDAAPQESLALFDPTISAPPVEGFRTAARFRCPHTTEVWRAHDPPHPPMPPMTTDRWSFSGERRRRIASARRCAGRRHPRRPALSAGALQAGPARPGERPPWQEQADEQRGQRGIEGETIGLVETGQALLADLLRRLEDLLPGGAGGGPRQLRQLRGRCRRDVILRRDPRCRAEALGRAARRCHRLLLELLLELPHLRREGAAQDRRQQRHTDRLHHEARAVRQRRAAWQLIPRDARQDG